MHIVTHSIFSLINIIQVIASPGKHVFPVTALDAAHKKALDSVPNMVTVINNYDPPERMNQFLLQGVQANKISILVFSDKAAPPTSLKGLAAAEARHLQVGFISEPSDAVLGNFGWSREKGVPLALGTYYSDGVREKQQRDTNWEQGPDASEGDDLGFRVGALYILYDVYMFIKYITAAPTTCADIDVLYFML